MIQLKSRIPSPIHIHGKIGKAFPTFTVTFKDGDTVLQQVQVKQGRTATYNGTVPAKDGNAFLGWVLSEPSNQIVDTDIFSETIYQQITNVQSNVTCWAVYDNHAIIRDSWDVISQRSTAGTASDYYNVGDMKRIHIEGTVGTLAVNQDVYVYILGFDHNSELEGSGITFGCFKDVNDLTDIALVDSYYETSKIDGTKTFNINHWGDVNYGGWAGCDLRYDILGSTDVAPSGYGTAPDLSRVGYDATSTCATSPIANTLMSCLPSDLRAIMKPITKYTDNEGNTTDYAQKVTSSIDYLPLLSEHEIEGAGNMYSPRWANSHEKDKQLQYAYFIGMNYIRKYNHSDNTVSCDWWARSPGIDWDRSTIFCMVDRYGNKGKLSLLKYSQGIAPIFLV